MTTNAPDALDKALTRPGRVDMHIHFELPSRAEIIELFLSMYSDELGGSEYLAPPSSPKASKGAANGSAHGSVDKIDPHRVQEKNVSDLAFKATGELQELAGRFAEALPEGKLSLADIQGFMLSYKRDPQEACRKAGEWARQRMSDVEARDD